MAAQTDRGVPLSTLCPKYLHTNSTSHTWPFSAIAELIDNAYDPDVNAQHFWIDKTEVSKQDCLIFMDDGNGLDYQTMHRMLSFGYSDKVALKGVQPIGIYGNGFKSGSMRLGKDAIVFSKSKTAMCIGMLSQTYLQEIKAEQIRVPIVCFEQIGKTISVKDEHRASLQDILRYSPFKTESALLTEINAIGVTWSGTRTGTRIIIWNLRRTSQGGLEIDFNFDRYDIRMQSDVYQEMNDTSFIPESVYSLRAYCSILYLKPRLHIMIRGKKVKSQLIAKSLAHSRKDHYKPIFHNKRIPVIFGYNTKSKDQYGIMMYHKNRLIKAYERVGCQLKADKKGLGVIGIIECNFLDPTHNKQSFEENDKYRKTMTNMGIKLEEYWKEIRFRRSKEDPTGIPVEDTIQKPDQNWVQCDGCCHWRKLPDGIDCTKLPDKWYCNLNPDPQFRSCQVEEEPEDSDDEQPSYCKTYKQQEREDKKMQERRRQQAERDQKQRQQQQLQAQLKQQADAIMRQLRQDPASLPTTPTTPRSRMNTHQTQGGSPLTPSSISQAACSPSTSNGLPVISNVCSLASMLRKRQQHNSPDTTPKRPRVNQVKNISDQVLSLEASPACSPSIPIDDSSSEETDDDLVILEVASTPKPKKNEPALIKVKTESPEVECDVNLLLECSDDAAVENIRSSTSADEATVASAAPPAVTNITTQTETPQISVKKENTDQGSTEQTKNNNDDAVACSSKDTGVCESDMKEEQLNGITPHPENEDRESPSLLSLHSSESHTEPNQVSELRQERDSLKEQIQQLQAKLQELQNIIDMSRINVKKEQEKEVAKEGQNSLTYKTLFENANTKINELIKEKQVLLATIEVKSDDKAMDEIALQVDQLMRELDECNKEKERLQTQLESTEKERGSLASECESLKLNLQQIKDNAAAGVDSSVQTDGQETSTDPGPSSHTVYQSLVALRKNVRRLLVTYVPFSLDQLNYEGDVIDDILEQVLVQNDVGSGNTTSSDHRPS
ncbi:MORC family CW-type zinc finger protein 3a [Eucyclogobius newberryi]|uniref:MORC family CW-type zinc finger protein 3a n=1 Tax=Eucyclogobius newberryi TaxID=166745 RepID=UPI003B58D455